MPPADWLALSPKQKGKVRVAAFSAKEDFSGAQALAWFESSPEKKTSASIELRKNTRVETSLTLPEASFARDRDFVHVAIVGEDGREIWQEGIPVMLVGEPPDWPSFGATETKLRYDAPISVRAQDGSLSSMDYAKGWKPELNDVVVSLPNGSRFVFWRGSSYVPFWAGRYNSGLCYEWAETSPPPDGEDCVEPLMDKQLRYGQVAVVESTSARIHVRWSYQSCDFNYKVWGDSAIEDFYFYPDGFGTRVLTLTSAPDGDYELSEFIILTPQATYPLRVLPENLVDVLFADGCKRKLQFPLLEQERDLEKLLSGEMPAVYRVRLDNRETSTAIEQTCLGCRHGVALTNRTVPHIMCSMKNITLSVDEKVLATVRQYAAEQGSSVNALVREFLARIHYRQDRASKARKRLQEMSRKSKARIGSATWSRDELHER